MVELCKSFPRRWDRSTLSHLQIRKSLFHAEHLNVKKLLLTTVKWRKVSCTTLAFLDTLSRNFITFVPVYGYFLWIKIVSLRKTYVFWKQDQLRMGKGAELFYTKKKLSQGFLPDMELLKKYFPTNLDKKNYRKRIFNIVIAKQISKWLNFVK